MASTLYFEKLYPHSQWPRTDSTITEGKKVHKTCVSVAASLNQADKVKDDEDVCVGPGGWVYLPT